MLGSVFAIMRKELISYFNSYIAYIIIALFLFVCGYFFYVPVIEGGFGSLSATYGNTLVILLFIMPIITMKLISEERKSGSLELLFTRPVNEYVVVAGKFLAAVTLWFVMLLPTASYAAILYAFAEPKPDLLPLLTQYLTIFLVGCAFIAVGIFASSLTENQIVAAFFSFTFILILWLLNWVSSFVLNNELISYFAIANYVEDLLKGVVDARDIVFYVSFMLFWLYAAVMRLYARRLG
jgi:ABC-2 type transport system permease protein